MYTIDVMIEPLLKPKSIRSKAYLAWIRLQPCLVCKQLPSQAAHVGRHGTSTKTDDFRALNLCSRHHLTGGDSLHNLNQEKFENLFGLDLQEQIVRHLIRYLADVLAVGDN